MSAKLFCAYIVPQTRNKRVLYQPFNVFRVQIIVYSKSGDTHRYVYKYSSFLHLNGKHAQCYEKYGSLLTYLFI